MLGRGADLEVGAPQRADLGKHTIESLEARAVAIRRIALVCRACKVIPLKGKDEDMAAMGGVE